MTAIRSGRSWRAATAAPMATNALRRPNGTSWSPRSSAASRRAGARVPILFGVDAVHGHSNVPGATLFPHNIGLGAARDPALIERIGAVTAAEIAGTGIEWTFAPTLAVPQDLRWGRSYEGYSADPALVAAYATAMVLGLQGELVAGKPLPGEPGGGNCQAFSRRWRHGRWQGSGRRHHQRGRTGCPPCAGLSRRDQRRRVDRHGQLFDLERCQAPWQRVIADRCAEGPDGLCRAGGG